MKKTPGPNTFTSEFSQIFKENKQTNTSITQNSERNERVEALFNLFCEASVTLMLKSDKDVTKKGNYWSVSPLKMTKDWQTFFFLGKGPFFANFFCKYFKLCGSHNLGCNY